MNRLWMLLFLFGCTSPTEVLEVTHEKYKLNFSKKIDTIFVDVKGTQATKYISATTNIDDGKLVLISSNIYLQVNTGFEHLDTISTVNEKSYINKGYVATMFGAFPNMIGMTATVIAKVVDDIRTVEEYRNINVRKVLAVDTMQMIIVKR